MPNRGALSLDERTSSLFQADPLSSSEFFETKTTSYLEPERFLMLAVLTGCDHVSGEAWGVRTKGKQAVV